MLSLLAALSLGATPVLLKDLEPGAAVDGERYLEVDTGAEPNLLVIDTVFWGAELFTILDGRRSLIADLCPGRCSSNPRELTRLGARVVFLADQNGKDGAQLWATSGFPETTVLLADQVGPGPRLQSLEGQVVFNRLGQLWISDGTREGTAPLGWGQSHTVVSAVATPQHRFLATRKANGGCALFATETNLKQATAFPMPSPSEECGGVAALGERAFLSFTSGVWRFDPATFTSLNVDAFGRGPIRAGGALFFFGFGPGTLSLFQGTGEPNGTTPLGTVPSEGLRQTAVVGPRLLYVVVDAMGQAHLHSSDGTPTGTAELKVVPEVLALVAAGPVAYVVVKNGTKADLIETDGTKSGTYVLPGIHPAIPLPGHSTVTGHALALAFVGTVVTDVGAFRMRPGEDPETLFNQPANPRDSAPSTPVVIGNQAFFTAGGVFRTDGTPEGTTAIADGGLAGRVRDRLLVNVNDALTAIDFDGGHATPLGMGGFAQAQVVNFGSTALIAAGGSPRTLFTTDGTEKGTSAVQAMGVGTPGPPLQLDDGFAVFPIGNRVWFTNGSPLATGGVELPNGTSGIVAGTDAIWLVSGNDVVRVRPGSAKALHTSPTPPASLIAWGTQAFFVEHHGPKEDQLWSADASGATLRASLGEIRALAVHHDRLMVLGDGKLFELADDGTLVFRARAPRATWLASAGFLYADVASVNEGQELHWFHEAFGLFLSTGDLSPGPGSSAPSPPVLLGPRVLFTAWSPETGREPFAWTPDPLPSESVRTGCGCASADGPLLAAGLLLWAWTRSRRRATAWSSRTSSAAAFTPTPF